MGKLAYEAHRIGQNQSLAGVEIQAPQGGIQGREQPVRGAHPRPGQLVKECRFTGIGVTHQGNHGYAGAATGSPAEFPARADPTQAPLDDADALRQQTPIALQLFLAGSAQPDATLLALQVRPTPYQPRRQVLQLGQFHLQLAFEGAGPLREDVQDERDAIQDTATQSGFQIAFLAGCQGVIEYHHLGVVPGYLVGQFLELAAADEIPGIRRAPAAGHGYYRLGAGRYHQIGEFLEIVAAPRALKCDVNQYGALAAIRTLKQARCSAWGIPVSVLVALGATFIVGPR